MTAWSLGEHANDPLKMYLMDAYTLSLNLAGLPGLSLPVAKTASGMPVGMQIIGKAFSEAQLLALGQVMETILPRIGHPSL